jgi:hypothetical protein
VNSAITAYEHRTRTNYQHLGLPVFEQDLLLEVNVLTAVKLVLIIFKNSVRTAKKTPHFTITRINWLTLFKEIIAVYSENHMKPGKYTLWIKQLFVVERGGTHSYH